LEILGDTVPNGTFPEPVWTTGSGNTVDVNVQVGAAISGPPADNNDAGLVSFDDTMFTVDANGFVQLIGEAGAVDSIGVDAFTPPGTNPVNADGDGLITINGAQVASGTTVNAIRTHSTALNQFNIEVQRSTTSAISAINLNGVAHFNSAFFTVDSNGFVSVNGTGLGQTITGNTGGPLSPTAGNWNIVTANSTPVFAGSGSTLTLDFGLSNLILGSSAPLVTTALDNVGVGIGSLQSLTTGLSNTCVGWEAGAVITTAINNVLIGGGAGGNLSTSIGNIAIGANALQLFNSAISQGGNTVIGDQAATALTLGVDNIIIGQGSGGTYTGAESSNILIGNIGVVGESNTIRIGQTGVLQDQQSNCHIAGIDGVDVGSVASVVSILGDHLGTTTITAGTGIDVTPGANTITVAVDGSSVGQTITGDTGGALSPTAGNWNILGDHGINTSGSGSTLTVAINNAITLGDLSGIATGSNALSATTGDINIASGNLKLPVTSALFADGVITIGTTRFHNFGTNNLFMGITSGNATLTGSANYGIGTSALTALTSGSDNIALGVNSGSALQNGGTNIAIGTSSLLTATSASNNVAIGASALRLDLTGAQNVAVGSQALRNVLGANNTAVGYQAGNAYTGTEANNISIGSGVTGTLGESGTTRIGANQTACYIDGIDGVNVGSVATVVTEAGDRLGTAVITAGSGITVTPGANAITISLSGGGTAIDSINVDAATGPGTDPVVSDGAGQITVTGGQIASNSTANVIRTNSLAANTYTIEVQQAGTAAAADTSFNGVAHFNSAQFSVSNGFTSILPGALPSNVSNIGFTYSGGTFTVHGYDGTALSATNPGIIWLQSRASNSELTRYLVTANQTFTDGSGGTLDNQRFGVTTGVNWTPDAPFFLYAVGNDAEDTISFMIARNPNSTQSPGTTSIGQSGAVVNVGQRDFFALLNNGNTITVTEYNANPCLCLGMFRMTFAGATDSWSVTALNNGDGIGRFSEGRFFEFPALQNGATSGVFSSSTGGDTIPVFTGGPGTYYKINRNGTCEYHFGLQTVSSSGVGTGNLRLHMPYEFSSVGVYNPLSSFMYRTIATGIWTTALCTDITQLQSNYVIMVKNSNGAVVQPADITTSVELVKAVIYYDAYLLT
jgi:hypothetical protein